mmetsp:Transcript_29391/g.113811  ORF Transcript_29391/g.113811 Transcript_29391/m.113811 type:complete len:211 (-) Transcript_29391:368-1000(-)
MSLPPFTLKTAPFADVNGKSRRGLEMALVAACLALLSPVPNPIPSSAYPFSCITDLTSAKSTLTRPGRRIMSEIPLTPCRKTSSATENASDKGVFFGTVSNSLSFDTTISVSTASLRLSRPRFPCDILLRPSNINGFVTTPTVRQPSSFATEAITGAAPVPVPPPIPAVINTRSPPARDFAISDLDSSAACFPTAGSPPAPRPRHVSSPS